MYKPYNNIMLIYVEYSVLLYDSNEFWRRLWKCKILLFN